jgi:hypothetical protein
MANLNNFDANQVDPSVALDPIPAGKYIAVVTDSELKPTKAGGGKYLQLTFQVVDGEHKGRLVWARLNLENKNEMTVKIARAELSAICRAVGVMAPKDSVELHNVPIEISVGLKKLDYNCEVTNVIKGYAKKGGNVGGGGGAAGARAPAGVGPGSTPPWKR